MLIKEDREVMVKERGEKASIQIQTELLKFTPSSHKKKTPPRIQMDIYGSKAYTHDPVNNQFSGSSLKKGIGTPQAAHARARCCTH